MKLWSKHTSSCIAILFVSSAGLWAERSDEDIRLDNQESNAQRQFYRGDYTPIDVARQNHDLALLWHIFRTATRATDKRTEIWDPVETRVRQALLSFPEHARFLGDQIESISSDHEKNNLRERYFSLLGAFGGAEAIAQLGRFLLDERNPMPPWITPMSIGTRPNENSVWAAWAIDKALGEESPWWPYRKNGQPPSNNANGPRIYEIMKQWWIDTGSKKYGLGLPPAIHPSPQLKAEAPSAPPAAPPQEAGWAWELPALIAFLFLAVLLTSLRKRRSA